MEWGGGDVFQLETTDVEAFRLEKNIKSEKVRFCIRMAPFCNGGNHTHSRGNIVPFPSSGHTHSALW